MKGIIYGAIFLLIQANQVFAQINKANLDGRRENYSTVKIGNQVWMSENLKIKKFRNGDSILHAKSEEEWAQASYSKIPAWCYYENDSIKGEKNGVLYNWFAVTDTRGLAPDGWYIPNISEFRELVDFLGGEEKACIKLKSVNSWDLVNGNNKSGFNANPGGFRFDQGPFANYGHDGMWWTVSEGDIDAGICLDISDYVDISKADKGAGLQVRCLQGMQSSLNQHLNPIQKTPSDSIPPYLYNDSVFIEVKIENQIWMGKNLNVSTFSNGDNIPEARTNEEWINAGQNKLPAWCYYQNDSTTAIIHGKLYNWYAVIDKRGLAPLGWRLPSDSDWEKLVENLGENAASKIKSTFGWKQARKGTNESGFCGVPSGHRTPGGYFDKDGYFCHWWSIPNYISFNAWWYLQSQSIIIERWESALPESSGFSVRCLKN